MKITVVGGGFGGVKATLKLANDPRNQVTIISDKADFQYNPALYSAATGRADGSTWIPLSRIFKSKKNVKVVQATIDTIDPHAKLLTASDGTTYQYDAVILALGTITTYFGIPGLQEFAYGIKSVDEVNTLKNHLAETIHHRNTALQHIAIVGAGPTGIELASELGGYINRLHEDFGDAWRQRVKIELIEAAPRVLPRMSEASSASVHQRLKRIGVHVQVGKTVESQTKSGLMVSGKEMLTQTVIWTSGVANHPFFTTNATHFEFAPNHRVIVDQYMQASPRVFIIGDNAATPFTGLAQTALHDASFVARHITRLQDKTPLVAYEAKMPPVVIPVGRNWAIFEWRSIRISGWIASLIRRAADIVGYLDILPLFSALRAYFAKRHFESLPRPVDK